MAERVEAPTVTVPAGTAVATPQTTNLTWQDGRIVRVEVRVPPGPSGFVGFALGHSNQVVIPRQSGQWIVEDDRTLDWDIERYPTGAKWFVRAYNTGLYAHTLYFRFHIVELDPPRAVTVQPIPVVAVGQSVDVNP